MRPKVFTDSWIKGAVPRIYRLEYPVDCSGLVALGSCFARNLSRWLHFNKVCQQTDLWDILYNPFSIRKELERLFTPLDWESWILEELTAEGGTRFRDPWRTWLTGESIEQLKRKNNEFDTRVRSYTREASTFLLTFGLSEVWGPMGFPNIVLNRVPVGSVRIDPKAWDHRFATYHEVFVELDAIVSTIRSNFDVAIPVILTLSPIPLKYTASTVSARVANNLSKATLLVAIHAVQNHYEGVYYYPSYEIVQALAENGSDVWQRDGRHITAYAADFVCRTFLDKFTVHDLDPEPDFWVPLVDGNGQVIGRLFVNGAEQISGGTEQTVRETIGVV